MEIPMKILHIGNEKNVEHYTAKTPFTESAEVVNLPIGLTDAAYAQLAPDAEVIIVDAVTEISEGLIKRLPSLRMIHSEGVAFNQINLEAELRRRDDAILDEIRAAGYEGMTVNGRDLEVF